MGIFNKKDKKETVKATIETISPLPSKTKKSKSTLKVKNDTSKMASFWVVDTKTTPETMLFSGTISECKDYIYLASKNQLI